MMNERTQYSLGFLFSPSRKQVLLIEKKRPLWQAGKLNGIGGRNKPNETSRECMEREFEEETGLEVVEWTKFAVLMGKDWAVHVFAAVDEKVFHAESMTDEHVFLCDLETLSSLGTVASVQFLVPLAVSSEVLGPVFFYYAS